MSSPSPLRAAGETAVRYRARVAAAWPACRFEPRLALPAAADVARGGIHAAQYGRPVVASRDAATGGAAAGDIHRVPNGQNLAPENGRPQP